jgi:hypothetical protein
MPNSGAKRLNGRLLLRKPRLYQSCSPEEEEEEEVLHLKLILFLDRFYRKIQMLVRIQDIKLKKNQFVGTRVVPSGQTH